MEKLKLEFKSDHQLKTESAACRVAAERRNWLPVYRDGTETFRSVLWRQKNTRTSWWELQYPLVSAISDPFISIIGWFLFIFLMSHPWIHLPSLSIHFEYDRSTIITWSGSKHRNQMSSNSIINENWCHAAAGEVRLTVRRPNANTWVYCSRTGGSRIEVNKKFARANRLPQHIFNTSSMRTTGFNPTASLPDR